MYKLLSILLFAYGLAVSTDDIYDNSYALIIGIDKYENVKNLNYAVKDAESIQDILVNIFNFPEGIRGKKPSVNAGGFLVVWQCLIITTDIFFRGYFFAFGTDLTL